MNTYLENHKLAELDALSNHPECSHADVDTGMSMILDEKGLRLGVTYVVKLWRNRECFLAGEPPRHICEGYKF